MRNAVASGLAVLLLLGLWWHARRGAPDGAAEPQDEPAAAPVALPLVDDMVEVPAGWYTAGCPRVIGREKAAACVANNPPRRVWVSSFAIDRLEVTRGEVRTCARAGGCPPLVTSDRPPPEVEPHLAAMVSWSEAAAYCAYRGKRLPTEAEWEKAARGTDERIFPWGDAPPTCDRGDFIGDRLQGGRAVVPNCHNYEFFSVASVRPGGQHPAGASPYGVLDMYGNAGEWVSDLQVSKAEPDAGVLRFFVEERAGHELLIFDWSSSRFAWLDPAVVDPTGPEPPAEWQTDPPLIERVSKGDPNYASIGARGIGSADVRREPVSGIRCVKSIPGPPPPELASPPPGTFVTPHREPGAPDPATAARTIELPVPPSFRWGY